MNPLKPPLAAGHIVFPETLRSLRQSLRFAEFFQAGWRSGCHNRFQAATAFCHRSSLARYRGWSTGNRACLGSGQKRSIQSRRDGGDRFPSHSTCPDRSRWRSKRSLTMTAPYTVLAVTPSSTWELRASMRSHPIEQRYEVCFQRFSAGKPPVRSRPTLAHGLKEWRSL